MADDRSREKRRLAMQAVRQVDTAPELIVRRLLHSLGYRYRLHRRDLPGTPDIVFPSRKKVIFVHGCFWHGHECRRGQLPKSRVEYWAPKLKANQLRDERVAMELRCAGWEVLVVWQCMLADDERLQELLCDFLAA
ncbi:very short patch repair endonuclease [Cupriavidus taiwanensis]|uniref:very short patch repair endonuclease n=1 Tax=Cupriavidus taiwanensis TaxID=164546 RepID=UPI000E20A43F|nr:very short patch repair endonuclease [Cupriavidus taiwanensis]